MQLLDRYLAAVARNLPARQAADIAAELKDNLLSEIEEKEAGLGRKLTDKELERLLIDFGHPLSVAARYGKPRQLIGPEVFPFFLATLRAVFGFVAAIVVVGAVIRIASGDTLVHIGQDLARIWPQLFTVFGVVVLVFAVMDRASKGQMKLKWSPRTLPPPKSRDRKPFQIVSEMTMSALFLLWWTGVVQFHALVPIPAFVHIHLAHVWAGLFWPILAYYSAEIAINALELARPAWVRLNAGLNVLKGVGGCAILAVLLEAGHWIDVNAEVSAFALNQMRHGFDRGMQVGMTITLIVLVGKAAWDLWRLIRGRPGDGRANGAASPAGAVLA